MNTSGEIPLLLDFFFFLFSLCICICIRIVKPKMYTHVQFYSHPPGLKQHCYMIINLINPITQSPPKYHTT